MFRIKKKSTLAVCILATVTRKLRSGRHASSQRTLEFFFLSFEVVTVSTTSQSYISSYSHNNFSHSAMFIDSCTVLSIPSFAQCYQIRRRKKLRGCEILDQVNTDICMHEPLDRLVDRYVHTHINITV